MGAKLGASIARHQATSGHVGPEPLQVNGPLSDARPRPATDRACMACKRSGFESPKLHDFSCTRSSVKCQSSDNAAEFPYRKPTWIKDAGSGPTMRTSTSSQVSRGRSVLMPPGAPCCNPGGMRVVQETRARFVIRYGVGSRRESGTIFHLIGGRQISMIARVLQVTSTAPRAGQCWRSSRSTRASHASTTDRGTSRVSCAALLKASAVR
jgi:hypothetical protein